MSEVSEICRRAKPFSNTQFDLEIVISVYLVGMGIVLYGQAAEKNSKLSLLSETFGKNLRFWPFLVNKQSKNL